MFVAARENTKEQKNVLREMAEILKKQKPQYSQEWFKEFDESHEQNQDAPLSKGGHRHVDWSQLTDANVEAIGQALTYMNISNVATRLRYTYRRVCDFENDSAPCHWCYSEITLAKAKTLTRQYNWQKMFTDG